MKPLLCFPISVALAAVFLLGTGLTHADDVPDQTHRDAAEKLVAAMHTEQMLDQNLNRMLALVDRFGQSAAQAGKLTPEQADSLKKAEDEARDTIRKELGYATLKDEFVKAYADAFTELELKEITVFYNSPVGQKLIEKQPGVTDKVAQISQGKVRTVMPGVVQKLREVAQKVLPPPPTPAAITAPVAPVAPIAPAAAPMPVAPGVPPAAPTPPVSTTTSPVTVMPTPVPSASVATTPSTQ